MNGLHELLRWPDYYPLSVDTDKRDIKFVRMSRAAYHDSVFLDTRTRHLGPACALRVDDVLLATSGEQARSLPVTYILHPAFCCSTLLSRYFELLSFCLVLKEPLLLTQVALASYRPNAQWPGLFTCAVRLLTRGYEGTNWIVIKVHEPCNVLGRKFLQERDKSTVIFLMTPQRQFMLSVLKSNERRAWVRSRVCELLAAGVAGSEQNIHTGTMSDSQAAACMWTINNALRCELSSVAERSRVLLLDSDQLIDDPGQCLRAISRTCQRPFDNQQIATMVDHPAMRKYSKNVSRAYDAKSRKKEIAELEERFGNELDAGIEWAARHSLSALYPEAQSRH